MACCLLPRPLHHPWLQIGSATDGTLAYVDTNSLAEHSGTIYVRQRFIFPKRDLGARRRVDQIVEYHCASRTARQLRSAEFDSQEKLIHQSTRMERPYRVPKGSLAEVILDLVC